jgi:hypothetical protein
MESTVEFKTFKDKSIVDLEHYKDVLDKTLKSITYQFEINEKNIKEFSNKVLKQCEAMYQSDLVSFHEKIDDVKLENGKYHLDTIKKAKELKESLEEAEKIKVELKQTFETELIKVKNYHGVKFDGVLADIRRIDVDLSFLNSNYKVFSNFKFF